MSGLEDELEQKGKQELKEKARQRAWWIFRR
jgi:hypothetical protein